MTLLMWLFLTPFIASFAALTYPIFLKKSSRSFSLLISLIPLLILVCGHSWIGAQVSYNWIPTLSIKFLLVVDHLSLIFLYLTAIIIPISIYAIPNDRIPYPNVFYALALLLQGLLIGFFAARDLILFTIFWESMLLPLYFIITIWGGPKRQSAGIKFLVYMISGSCLMVAAVLSLYLSAVTAGRTSSFDFDTLSKISENARYAWLILPVFLLAFSVKAPLFPFHAWLPDAYCEAPTGGTILLSAILSKAGIYGILRIGIELFPNMIKEWSPWMLGLSITGIFYGGLAAWMQKDFKRLIAYSSFSHVNFIIAGLFVWNASAQDGAILQAVNHGITIAALFLVAGWLEDRLGSTTIGQYSGLAKYFPNLCWFTLIFVLSSVALPGTNNFVGELMILFGLFSENPYLAAFVASTVILSAIYMLRFMQKVYFETPSPDKEVWVDIKGTQVAMALSLSALIFWIGIYPSTILKQIEPIGERIVLEKPL